MQRDKKTKTFATVTELLTIWEAIDQYAYLASGSDDLFVVAS